MGVLQFTFPILGHKYLESHPASALGVHFKLNIEKWLCIFLLRSTAFLRHIFQIHFTIRPGVMAYSIWMSFEIIYRFAFIRRSKNPDLCCLSRLFILKTSTRPLLIFWLRSVFEFSPLNSDWRYYFQRLYSKLWRCINLQC